MNIASTPPPFEPPVATMPQGQQGVVSAPPDAAIAAHRGGSMPSVGFIDVWRSEVIKLRSLRGTWYVPIGAMAMPLLGAVLVSVLLSEEVVEGLMLVVLATLVIPFSAILGFVTTIVTSEYNHGTIRVTYAATPRRLRSVLAKYALAVSYSVVALAIAIAVPLAVGFLIVLLRGQTEAPDGQMIRDLFWSLFNIGCASVAAVSLGYFVRNSAAAISIAAVYPLGINIVLGFLSLASFGPAIVRWFPLFGAMNVGEEPLDGGSELSLGYPWAYIYLAVFVTVIALIAARFERRRDV